MIVSGAGRFGGTGEVARGIEVVEIGRPDTGLKPKLEKLA